MRTLPVYWHEGMFLRPHHFQAADRYWADQVAQSGRWDVPYNWGVRRIAIDTAALTNYRFVVTSLQARMRDGTVVRVPQDASLRPLEEKDLKKAFDTQDRVEVVLAVPTLDVGRPNVVGAGTTRGTTRPGTRPRWTLGCRTRTTARPTAPSSTGDST
ncbi:type VI secretion system baseplate subunit TssK [Fimbriiglobus ruber]|uniref:Uncharacterized protein ImpJ/VasE n=1 Tax=Fimbriiglobus ruber TaxID=1908690 RepID=A0A225DKE3_9BACT|nr:Uncharacterized protein ImpJ/VasE [Fimbriiglobus ruber]